MFSCLKHRSQWSWFASTLSSLKGGCLENVQSLSFNLISYIFRDLEYELEYEPFLDIMFQQNVTKAFAVYGPVSLQELEAGEDRPETN